MARILVQVYFLLTSFSGIFMGINFILYCFCAYVLWGQSRKLLLLSSTIQFALCVAQTALFIVYLISAIPAYASGAENYFQTIIVYSLPCYIIYTLNCAIEGFLLIWRIFILYNRNFKICIPSSVLLALQVVFCGVTAKGFATEAVFTGRLHAFYLVTWALIAAVNISATVLICLRLWIARQRTAALSQSKYKSTIIVVVECGAMVTICTVAMLIMYAVAHPGALAGLGITTQVTTTAPLLIVARYGILSREDGRRLLASRMPLRISVVQTAVTCVDASKESSPIQKDRMCLDAFPDSPIDDHPKPSGDV